MKRSFRRTIKRWFLMLLFFLICIAMTVSTVIVGNGYMTYRHAIQEEPLEIAMQSVHGQSNFVPLAEVNPIYLDAVIAIEDHRFYKHQGIDARAMLRAIKTDIQTGSYAEGGSTISQQLAKNLYFSHEKSLNRKIAEIFMARALEKNYNKVEILEAYINTIYFGNGYYGIYKAAVGYYDALPSELTKNQATLLAGVPNAPNAYAPNTNMNLARQRQRQVLDAMVKYHFLPREEADKIQA